MPKTLRRFIDLTACFTLLFILRLPRLSCACLPDTPNYFSAHLQIFRGRTSVRVCIINNSHLFLSLPPTLFRPFSFPSWMRWTFQRGDIRTHFVARLSVPLWQQSALYLGRRGGFGQHHQVLISICFRCEYIVRFHCPSSTDRYITKPIRTQPVNSAETRGLYLLINL